MISSLTERLAAEGPSLSNFALASPDYFEFAQKVALVPIVRGDGRPGRRRWLCRNNYEQPDALGALRAFVTHCLTYYEVQTGMSLSKVEVNEFVGASIAHFLDADVTPCESLYYAIGSQNRALILYRDDAGYFAGRSRESIVRTVWLLETKECGHA